VQQLKTQDPRNSLKKMGKWYFMKYFTTGIQYINNWGMCCDYWRLKLADFFQNRQQKQPIRFFSSLESEKSYSCSFRCVPESSDPNMNAGLITRRTPAIIRITQKH